MAGHSHRLTLFLTFVLSLWVTTAANVPSKYRMTLYDVYHPQLSDEETKPLQYDCLYANLIDSILSKGENYTWTNQLVEFCFRPGNETSSFTFDNLSISALDHKTYTFIQLKNSSISSSQLLDWSAPIDLVENYQAYLDRGKENSPEDSRLMTTEEHVFFNCTSPWFGSRCQYFFSIPPVPLEEHIHQMFSKIHLFDPPQPSCYIHLTCKHESPIWCLDWREICDGREDCLNGEDERECWRLEANQCDEDEYRCHNGQCIPLDLYHDDSLSSDCMDRSDEPISTDLMNLCSMDVTFRCEEASCYPQMSTYRPYSCGNGQCIVLPGEPCDNDRFEHIELPAPDFPWIGMSSSCFSAMTCLTDLSTPRSLCRCGKGFTRTCVFSMMSACSSQLFLFPTSPILLGHIYFVYNRTKVDRRNDTMTPMYVCFNGEYCRMENRTLHKILNRTCVDYESEFGSLFYNYPPWELFKRVIETRLSMACASSKHDCPHPYMYNCDHSLRCISTVRLRDTVDDCPLGDDERVMHTCSLNETNINRFRCPDENWCLSPLAINNGVRDCLGSEDEIHPNLRHLQNNILFKFICDGFQDMLPINIHDENMTDETECEQWRCNNTYTHCNSFWDCPKGEDELQCEYAAIVCSAFHHPCISPNTTELICLPIEKVRDNTIDCLGGSDERHICRNLYPFDKTLRYLCYDGKECESRYEIDLCNTAADKTLAKTTPKMYNCGWKNLTSIQKHLCSLEVERDFSTLELRISDIESSNVVRNRNDNQIAVKSHSPIIPRNVRFDKDSCFRGVPIYVRTKSGLMSKCICPPNAYGDHCQYQNQRVSLTVQAQSASDWRSMFTFIFMLITDQNEIEFHDHRYYSPSTDCAIKWNIYLLYQSRPKDLTKNYSVRIDVYKRETMTLEYRASWDYPLHYSFLPVYRLAVQVTIPSRITVIDGTVCTLDCHEHGSCIVANPNTKKKKFLCRCNPNWFGNQCQYSQVPAVSCSCAPGSLCISSYPTSICVCPINRGGPRCYIKLGSCEESSQCLNNGQCVPDDERRHSLFVKKCLCHEDFWGEYCQFPLVKLIVSFHPTISIPSIIYLHIIQDKQLTKHQRITIFKKMFPYETSAVIRTTIDQFDLVFTESNKHYYFTTFKRDNGTEIKMHVSPERYCPSINQLFNSSFIQFHLLRRIKYYHTPCQEHADLSCFYDEVHMCICHSSRHSICTLFEHNKTHICQGDSGNCENGGQCFQDDAKCPTMSACLCDDCFYGSKCQFSTEGLSLSLDNILGYHISPDKNLTTQLFVIKFSIILIGIMFVIGIINGLFATLVFVSKETQKVGCGLYLLVTSLLSILIIIMLALKFIFLLLAQMTYITNTTVLRIQCVSIDFILQTCLTVSDWLNACVSIERASAVAKGVHFSQMKSKQIGKRVIIFLFFIIAVFNLHDPISRRLITDDNERRTWCIVNYSSPIRKYNFIIQIFHFLASFVCNIISASMIIYNIARRRFVIQKQQSFKKHIHKQLTSNKHLIISPIILVLFASPRLIISLLSDCMKSTRDPWLFLAGYFTSFVPAVLVFVVFVLPSETYTNEFKKLFVKTATR